MDIRKFIDTSEESVSMYFKEVRKEGKVLTVEEEIELAKLVQKGDKKSKDKLIKSNLRFVISVAKEYQGQGLPLPDLIAEGNYGLIKAAEKFDVSKGYRFISYAVWWVKQSILQSLNDNSRTVRLPVNITNEMAKVKKEMDKFEQINGRKATQNDMDISKTLQPTTSSLNAKINEDGDEVLDVIEDTSILSPDEGIFTEQVLKEELGKTLEILTDRERDIIYKYFGIDGNPMTLETIGDEYGLTKERVRQIKEKAIRRIRYNSDNLMQFMFK